MIDIKIIKTMRTMRAQTFILVLLLFFSCEQNKEKSQIDKTAIALNDSAVKLEMTFDNKKMLEAIKLFNQAIKLQPNYFIAYWNKMSLQNQLGLRKEAFETLKEIEHLRPNVPEVKASVGVYIETNGNVSEARKKYIEAENLYKNILDTLKIGTVSYQTTSINRALNLKLLGYEKESNKILTSIQQNEKNAYIKELINNYLKMTKTELLENLNAIDKKTVPE